MIIDLLINIAQYISDIIVFIMDTILIKIYNTLTMLIESIILGIFGIFKIATSEDVGLISALIIVALFSAAVTFLYPIVIDYLSSDNCLIKIDYFQKKKSKKRKGKKSYSSTSSKNNNTSNTRKNTSTKKSTTTKKSTPKSTGKNKTTVKTTKKGETKITTSKEIKTPTTAKRGKPRKTAV